VFQALNGLETAHFAVASNMLNETIMEQQTVSMQQMIAVLTKEVGSRFPVKITKSDGEEIVRYIRGFADAQTKILLISESSYSLALKIIEVKDIRKLEYASENSEGKWKILHAKWLKKSARPLTFYLGFIGLFFSFHHAGS
jgi:hypothetical protein